MASADDPMRPGPFVDLSVNEDEEVRVEWNPLWCSFGYVGDRRTPVVLHLCTEAPLALVAHFLVRTSRSGHTRSAFCCANL